PPAPPKHSMFTNPESFSLVGAAWYSEEDKFDKKKFAKFSEEKIDLKNRKQSWISMVQHHFVSAWIPGKNDIRDISTNTTQENGVPHYVITSLSPALTVGAGKAGTFESTLWVGPKLHKE